MDRDRRLFCQAGLALAAGCAAGCGGTNMQMADMANSGTCGTNAVGVGNVAEVAVGQVVSHSLPVTNVFICRDANGLYALDAGCTHLGCDVAANDMNDVSKGFKCPCHGATYDANGLHPTSPAPRPLNHYLLCAQPSGALAVDPTVVVDPTTRIKG